MITAAEWDARMRAGMPHGPDDPCTCDGYMSGAANKRYYLTEAGRCMCWPGRQLGCTCDIAWDTAYELRLDGRPES